MFLLFLIHFFTPAQQPITPFRFEKIIFHSSGCYSSCPLLDLEIDSNRNIFLKRKMNLEDTARSGSFKGKIDEKAYFNLVADLISSDYQNQKWPPDDCCDIPVITIIVYANGKRTYLKSMIPPGEARKLISFLYGLGTDLNLPPTTEKVKLED